MGLGGARWTVNSLKVPYFANGFLSNKNNKAETNPFELYKLAGKNECVESERLLY
jgi:hypothetical protein